MDLGKKFKTLTNLTSPATRKPVSGRWKGQGFLNKLKKVNNINKILLNHSGPVYNVILIGSTGVGKSKWGNYLASYGQQQFFKVATADQTTSCSQVRITLPNFLAHSIQELEARTVEVLDGNVLLNIIDTPGLNEKEKEKDMEHMLKLFSYILQLK